MEYQLQKITENFSSIPITASCLDKIKAYAKLSRKKEIYGFLLNPLETNDGIVRRTIIAAQQEVTSSSVNLEAKAAAISKAEIEELGMKTIGFWHSHGGFSTFHSNIDDTNLDQLYRDIARNNEETANQDKTNFRYLDQKRGQIIYRIGELELAISPRDPERPCERRILNGQATVLPKNTQLGLTGGPTPGLYLRDGQIIIELGNIKDFSVSQIKPENYKTLGLAYSLVVNEGETEYGEIAAVKWCSQCQESSVEIYKSCKTGIINDAKSPTEKFSTEELEKEIKEKTKKGFF